MINKKNLFILLSRIPYPLEKGDKLRAYHQIKYLSKYYNIILCSFYFSSKENKIAQNELKKYCKKTYFIKIPILLKFLGIIQVLFSNLPLQTGLFYNLITNLKLKKIINSNKIDVVYCQMLRTAPYLNKINKPKVIDFQDALSLAIFRRIKTKNIFLKLIFKIEYQRLKKYETKILKLFDAHTIISENDKNQIINLYNTEINVISNGIDFEYYQANENNKIYDIIFTGNMNYPPNIDACEYLINDIMPLIWKKYPLTKVVLAGTNPNKKVIQLKSKNVLITGFVDDLRDYYSKSKVFIAPMRLGAGLQNKILEAMAMKIPVITSVVANKSLKATHNIDLLVSENKYEYAKNFIELVENKEIQLKISNNAYHFIINNFNWNVQNEKLYILLEKVYNKYN